MNKEILGLAIPNIISNITVPLLGMVDLAVVGHMGSEAYIGAIAVATMIFNFIYWNFSFLRMGTSGFAAQAFGADDKKEESNIFLRSLIIASIIGILILLLQPLILQLGFYLFNTEANIKMYVIEYFNIYIWAAPAVLWMYVFTGWFIGMQDAKTPMFIAIGINIVNIALCLFFVYVLGLKIKGVALASLCAQYVGVLSGFIIWMVKYKDVKRYTDFKVLRDVKSFFPYLRVNTDIFIRTMALVCVTSFFVSMSTRSGNTILAVNTLIMQLFILFSYMMDGFAYAAEALTGKLIGSNHWRQLHSLTKRLFVWGIVVVCLFTLVYGLFFEAILNVLTNEKHVILLALDYKYWALLIPVAGFSAFLWDGIFVGATASRQMRNSMLIAVSAFFGLYFIFHFLDIFSNNILWLLFIIYLILRGLMQSFMAPAVLNGSK